LLVAGDCEASEAINDSFCQKLIENSYHLTLPKFKNKNHVFIDNELGEESDQVFSAILIWLAEHRKNN
jgi:hypothetical protein